jgi:hypothetical protein
VYGPGEFFTAHSLFGIPVIEDEEAYDDVSKFVASILSPTSERFKLLQAARVIVWDEFLSNNRHCLEAAARLLNNFEGKVLLCMGDCRQIGPVVREGDANQIMQASMMASPLWGRFEIAVFKTNMRLFGMATAESVEAFEMRKNYAQMLLAVGNKTVNGYCVPLQDESEEMSLCKLPLLQYMREEHEIIHFVYPNGFQTTMIESRAILAGTNEQCDIWNKSIQDMNPNLSHECISHDIIHEVDDANGCFQSMLTEEVLSRYKGPNVPPHILNLKVGDICLVMRTLTSRGDQISTNTRVRILSIGTSCIRVETFSNPSRRVCIPRIKFIFGLPWGHSFKIMRKQFPLRLAYSMTFNKSQGQEFTKVALDVRVPVFSHGFLYVGLSRIRNVEDIVILQREFFEIEGDVVIHNVVYPSLLEAFQAYL